MKTDKGYFCDVCGRKISKYKLDFRENCAIVYHKKFICLKCRKSIGRGLIDDV